MEKNNFESQQERADKIADPLARKFQDRQLIIIFYDETTPTNLYRSLSQHGLTKTLHKWGYGTDPKAPKIEGAEYFDTVYSFPMPSGHKPVCYDDTALPSEPQKVQVVDLRGRLNLAAQTTFMEEVKRFAAHNKYSLFAAGAAAAIAACVALHEFMTKSPDQR